jgi:hypothetical protein
LAEAIEGEEVVGWLGLWSLGCFGLTPLEGAVQASVTFV